MAQLFRTNIQILTLFLFTTMTLWWPAANAEILSTGSADKSYIAPAADTNSLQSFIMQEKVQQQLIQLGVNPDLAIARVASLTPAERQLLEKNIADLPAGAGVVEVIGIVFIVLLILELLGVTDIFKKI